MRSDPRNPRLGDKATRSERGRVIVQMVDDEIEDLWREGGRHRSFLPCTGLVPGAGSEHMIAEQ